MDGYTDSKGVFHPFNNNSKKIHSSSIKSNDTVLLPERLVKKELQLHGNDLQKWDKWNELSERKKQEYSDDLVNSLNQDKEDEKFEESHGMKQGQVKKNRLESVISQYTILTDSEQSKIDELTDKTNFDELSSLQLRDLHMMMGGMERSQNKINNLNK